MPRDKDKHNAYPRGRGDRVGGRKGRTEGTRKKFGRGSFGGKLEEGGRPHHRGERDRSPARGRDEAGERREFRHDGRQRGDVREDRGKSSEYRGDRSAQREFRGNNRERSGAREIGSRKRSDKWQEERVEAKPWRRRDHRRREDPDREDKGDRPSRFAREWDRRVSDGRPKFGRPRFERPRRENDEERKSFTKRPAFGGRGAYRERNIEVDKRAPREEAKPRKSGERIAKVLARAGLASRRDAEDWIVQGRVAVNGRTINSPALDVTVDDVIAVDGTPLPPRERTRLFLYHKPRGLMTTHADPEGRPTVFDSLPEGLPRLISVGRLDFNTEGLLLLTNDGGLARVLELPETGWLRRYRVRAHGEVTQAQLDALSDGVEIDGVKYRAIDAKLEREQGSNVWLVFAIREGKNREVRNVLSHLGLEVNRLIRISYGPFQLGELPEGQVDEVKTRVLREQLGEKVIARAGADFTPPAPPHGSGWREAPRREQPFRPSGKSALITDRKGHRVLVQRTGSEEGRARNEAETRGYGPPRRPKRGYHGKRDWRPRES
jgi:23S rRNA pseudouridine2605 synthase